MALHVAMNEIPDMTDMFTGGCVSSSSLCKVVNIFDTKTVGDVMALNDTLGSLTVDLSSYSWLIMNVGPIAGL